MIPIVLPFSVQAPTHHLMFYGALQVATVAHGADWNQDCEHGPFRAIADFYKFGTRCSRRSQSAGPDLQLPAQAGDLLRAPAAGGQS
jgi:hypothetical protein